MNKCVVWGMGEGGVQVQVHTHTGIVTNIRTGGTKCMSILFRYYKTITDV